MKKRKIAVITSRRGEYGEIRPVLEAIQVRDDLEYGMIVTSMHLEETYGYTVKEIEKHGHPIYGKIKCTASDDSGAGMAHEISLAIDGIVKICEKEKPDIIVVSTDLGVPLAGAITGALMNIPVAHVDAGEISGSVDESLRHATTRLSHILFATSKLGKERLLKMGEEPARVFLVGYPRLDHIIHKKLESKEELVKKMNLDPEKEIVIMTQHPVTTEPGESKHHVQKTIDAILELYEEDKGFQVVLIYPNADAGGRAIIEIVKKYENTKPFKIFNNLDTDTYLSLMKNAKAMIGNSSSGIAEAPSFGLASVNVGTRQRGRERAENVIDVDYDKEEIKNGLKKALFDEEFRKKAKQSKNPYGDGDSGKKIADILATIKINQNLLQKRVTY